MTTELRTSQVEVLRAVAAHGRPITPAELGGVVGPPGGVSVRAPRARLERLREARFLYACLELHPCWPNYRRRAYGLTQLGQEALEALHVDQEEN